MQVVASPCWEMALPDVISASPSLDDWTCTAAARWVLVPVSSPATSAFPATSERVGTNKIPLSNFRADVYFAAVVISYVQSSRFACPPDCSHRHGSTPRGGQGVYVRAEHVSLPSHASDMLAVRTRQLTAEDLHLIRLTALSAAPGAFTRWTTNEVSRRHRISSYPNRPAVSGRI